ncbi:MAG: glycosyltransferase family 1 protein [Pseudomonadota bacterium]
MNVGIFYPDALPASFRVCADNISAELEQLNVRVLKIKELNAIPSDVDVLWDPRAGGGNPPPAALCGLRAPLVVTLHGVAPMAIPLLEYYGGLRAAYAGWRSNRRKVAAWRKLEPFCAEVVTVSSSSRSSILSKLPIPAEKVSYAYNAVDHGIFTQLPATNPPSSRAPYFLHVSNDEKRKNVDLICRAYRALPGSDKPRLILKLTKRNKRYEGEGVEVLTGHLSEAQLIDLYQNALSFIFPSAFEGFGIPIVEAMATGCPVITSKFHACAEVAGDAALLVDHAHPNELRDAMSSLAQSESLRDDLRNRGLVRAQAFSWAATAEHYKQVFENAVRDSANG